MKRESDSAADVEFSERLELQRPESRHVAHLFVARRSAEWLEQHAADWLQDRERQLAAGLTHARRRTEWLLGRYCAKRALSALAGGAEVSELSIASGVFGQPLARGAAAMGLRVSIAHSAGWGAAIAFGDDHPMGIDLEAVDVERGRVVRSQATAAELALLESCEADEAARLMWLWTAKEALAKTLGTGLMTPMTVYELAAPRRAGGWLHAEFTQFAQYRAQTMFFAGMAMSVALPRRSTCVLSAERVRVALERR